MSTLAAARADNMYYPPEWRPEMGGISKFQGSKGANQYEQYGKIRFELPVHGWCLGCGRHIGRVSCFFRASPKWRDNHNGYRLLFVAYI